MSNFSGYQPSYAQHISGVPIAVNQIEFHPWFQRSELVNYCHDTNTVVEASAPLAQNEIFDDEVVQELAETYDRSAAQIVIKWAIDRDVVPLQRSGTPDHVRQNGDSDWQIDEDDLRRLDERNREYPVYDTPTRDWTTDVYGIER